MITDPGAAEQREREEHASSKGKQEQPVRGRPDHALVAKPRIGLRSHSGLTVESAVRLLAKAVAPVDEAFRVEAA